MKKRITLLILLIVGLSFSACKKEEEKEKVDKEKLIQSHVWKGNEVKTFTNGTESGTLSISDYEFNFEANKNYSISKNGNVELSGTWEYVKGNPDILRTTDINNLIKEYTIDELTDSKFEFSIESSSSTSYKYFLIK